MVAGASSSHRRRREAAAAASAAAALQNRRQRITTRNTTRTRTDSNSLHGSASSLGSRSYQTARTSRSDRNNDGDNTDENNNMTATSSASTIDTTSFIQASENDVMNGGEMIDTSSIPPAAAAAQDDKQVVVEPEEETEEVDLRSTARSCHSSDKKEPDGNNNNNNKAVVFAPEEKAAAAADSDHDDNNADGSSSSLAEWEGPANDEPATAVASAVEAEGGGECSSSSAVVSVSHVGYNNVSEQREDTTSSHSHLETELEKTLRQWSQLSIDGSSVGGRSAILAAAAAADKDESLRGSSGRSIFQELQTIPDERDWERPISWHDPRTMFRKLRLLAGMIVEQPKVQLTIILLIVINALIMGIATFDFVTENEGVDMIFDRIDQVFLSIFTIELGLQVLYRGLSLFFDGWLVFDFVIVVASWSLETLQIIRAFRIFRAFRLITRIGPLRELVMALAHVMPRLYAITMLLLLVFYIFAVLFTSLYGDLALSDNYFGSLDASLFTCMQFMTMEWVDVAREVMAQTPWAWLSFMCFIGVSGFIVFNLIVAVVCDAVAVTEKQYKKEREDEAQKDAEELIDRAQERIDELTAQVDNIKEQHSSMQQTVNALTLQIQLSVQMMQQQQQQQQQQPHGEQPQGQPTGNS